MPGSAAPTEPARGSRLHSVLVTTGDASVSP